MNRFDLEESIMACWSTKEDIELIKEKIEKKDFCQYEIYDLMSALATLHDARCEKLFNIFEKLISKGEIVTKSNFDWGDSV